MPLRLPQWMLPRLRHLPQTSQRHRAPYLTAHPKQGAILHCRRGLDILSVMILTVFVQKAMDLQALV